MRLIHTLLVAQSCKTRKEAQEIIRKADELSKADGGLPFGFPLPQEPVLYL